MENNNMGALARGMEEYLDEQKTVEQGAQVLVQDIRSQLPQAAAAETLEAAQVNQLLGMVRYGQFLDAVNRVALLKTLQQLKERKGYRGAAVQAIDGQILIIKTWEELCKAVGMSRRQVEEDLANMAMFGESMLEAQSKMGVGYRQLRGLRGTIGELPEDKRLEVQQLIDDAVASGDKENLLATLEEIGSRNKKLSEDIKAAKADAEAARAAKTQALQAKLQAEDELIQLKAGPRTEDEHAALMRTRRVNLLIDLQHITAQIMGLSLKMANLVNAGPVQDDEPVIDGETMDALNREASQMCQIVRDNLLKGGFDVDFAAEFGMDPMTLSEDAEEA